MGGAGIQCGSAGIAFARASSRRDRASMLKFVSFGCTGVTGVTPETNRAALEAYDGRKPPLGTHE